MDQLSQLKLMRKRGLISDAEFKTQSKTLIQERRKSQMNHEKHMSSEADSAGFSDEDSARRARRRRTRSGGRSRSGERRRKRSEHSRAPHAEEPTESSNQQPITANAETVKLEYKVIHHRFVSEPLGKDSPRNLFYEHENDEALEGEYANDLQKLLDVHAAEGWKLQSIDRSVSNRISLYGSRPGDAAPREKEYRVARDLVLIFEKVKRSPTAV